MIHVYVGPTLPRDEPLLGTPQVRVLPPVRHGDFFDPAITADDTAVVIDGVYHHAAALRHKEILSALSRGVTVIGAASIGALRAAELHQFGMRGIGAIFRAYARGAIDGDDEVAVGQDPEGLQALTWPLVNLRHVLNTAAHEGVVDSDTAARVLDALRAVFYPQRTTAAVLAVCRRNGAEHVAGWLSEHRERDPHFGNLKRLDALEAVRAACTGARPAPGAPTVLGTHWKTGYYQRWANHFAREHVNGLELATEHRLAYQQIFDPLFPRVWLDHLDHLSRHPDDDSEGMPLAERMARLTGERPSPLPAHVLFRPAVDLRDPVTVARLLGNETGADRAAISRYEACNAEARESHPGFMTEAIDDDLTSRTLLHLWECEADSLDEEATARGFRGSPHAVEVMKHFVAGLLRDQAAAKGRDDDMF